MDEEVVYGDMWGFTHQKPIVEKPVDVPTWEKIPRKILIKILRTIYFGDQGLHCIGPQIIVELVDMEESFIWLPTIARLTESGLTDLEFHCASTLSIATMSVD